MKKTLLVMGAMFLLTGVRTFGQSNSSLAPKLTTPVIDGSLHYSLGAAVIAQIGIPGNTGIGQTTSLSGNFGYVGRSARAPLSMLASGGLLFSSLTSQSSSSYFQNFAISQGYIRGPWILGVSDSFSYLPQSPTTGISGIPGLGDLGTPVFQTPGQSTAADGLLTNFGSRINNGLSGSVERRLGSSMSVSGSGTYSLLHFLNPANGLDYRQYGAQAGLNRRLDARDTVSVTGDYSTYSYSGLGAIPGLKVNVVGISGGFQRLLSRSFSANVSAGPQWISGSDKTQVPSRMTFGAGMGLTYSKRFTTASLQYSRGANGGSGVQQGAVSDNISGSVGRSYGRDWAVSVTGSYRRSSGLSQGTSSTTPALANGANNTVYGGAQVTRRLGNAFSGYLSYTLQKQSVINALLVQNAFNGTSQSVGVGITFSPRSTHLGQF